MIFEKCKLVTAEKVRPPEPKLIEASFSQSETLAGDVIEELEVIVMFPAKFAIW